MPDRSRVRIRVDGREVEVARGATVAAALTGLGVASFRTSVTGGPRGPLCGMGICFECRLSIDGGPPERACMTLCRDGMEIVTNAG
ncbi:MAG TPA: (2Fe-2S)-binding protein [Thermoanaerobaculia bacterium]|nr:(2Fe-2S)-binding protein [Thermoanaerobaculia bacterium]